MLFNRVRFDLLPMLSRFCVAIYALCCVSVELLSIGVSHVAWCCLIKGVGGKKCLPFSILINLHSVYTTATLSASEHSKQQNVVNMRSLWVALLPGCFCFLFLCWAGILVKVTIITSDTAGRHVVNYLLILQYCFNIHKCVKKVADI